MEPIMLLTTQAVRYKRPFRLQDIENLMHIDDYDELTRRIEEQWGLSVTPPDPYTAQDLFSKPPTYTPPRLPHRLLFAGWEPFEVELDSDDEDGKTFAMLMKLDYKWTMMRLLQADSLVRDDYVRETDGWTWFDECYRLASRLMDMGLLSQPLRHGFENIALCIEAFLVNQDLHDLTDFVAHDKSFALPDDASNIYSLMRLCARGEWLLAPCDEGFSSAEAAKLVHELESLRDKLDSCSSSTHPRYPAYVRQLERELCDEIRLYQ